MERNEAPLSLTFVIVVIVAFVFTFALIESDKRKNGTIGGKPTTKTAKETTAVNPAPVVLVAPKVAVPAAPKEEPNYIIVKVCYPYYVDKDYVKELQDSCNSKIKRGYIPLGGTKYYKTITGEEKATTYCAEQTMYKPLQNDSTNQQAQMPKVCKK